MNFENRSTPEIFRLPLERQLETMLSAGFHQELGISEQIYIKSVQNQISLIDRNSDMMGGRLETSSGGGVVRVDPALVEPRIHYLRQAQLLGIKVDPSLIDDVVLPSLTDDGPQVVFNHRFTNGYTPRCMLNFSPIGFEPAHPIMGLVDHKRILAEDGITIFSGPELEKKTIFGFMVDLTESPCLDTFLGKPRLTTIPLDVCDRFLGVMFRYRYPRYEHKPVNIIYIPVDFNDYFGLK